MTNKNFYVYQEIEYRSDDPTWILYQVILDKKKYLMAYSNNKLKEVYFIDTDSYDYFMSCRADDLHHISYYFKDRYCHELRRYENGVMNRTYYTDKDGIIYCDTHSYTKATTDEKIDEERLCSDLEEFLQRFESSGIQIKRPDYLE